MIVIVKEWLVKPKIPGACSWGVHGPNGLWLMVLQPVRVMRGSSE